MTEEEISSWLNQTMSPIRKVGALSRDEVAAAVTAYLENGLNLFEDALVLASNGKIPRAAALTILGLEEIAKIPFTTNTFLHYEHGIDREAWERYWKSGGIHRKKQELILAYGQTIRDQFDGDPMHERTLYRFYAPEAVLGNLDRFKQSNFYVDIRNDGLHAPREDQQTRHVFDYLLTFGQERADSFGAWHTSKKRSADFLDLALGKSKREKWTASYAANEIQADFLYQATSLSASLVPNYAAFCDFAEHYKKDVSNTRIKEALISLATLLRRRVEKSRDLPLYNARYIGAFKLLFSLSRQGNFLGTSFSRKLSAELLTGGRQTS